MESRGLVDLVLVIVKGFVLGRWEVIDGGVQAVLIRPVHPLGGSQFDVFQ